MKEKSPQDYKYIRNPDVVLREEDPDGALLFNPDTNQIKVINKTALFIWKLCDGNNDLSTIIEKLKESFENVPGDEVVDQVKEFLNEMTKSGFIGIPEEEVK
jgi:hypothetical protein